MTTIMLLATPVYCEFRYVYAVFCSIPFILISINNETGELDHKI